MSAASRVASERPVGVMTRSAVPFGFFGVLCLHSAFPRCIVVVVVWPVWRSCTSKTSVGPARPPDSLEFFSPTQINVSHLIKDASCRLSSICLLSPASSPFPPSFPSLLPFLHHAFILLSEWIPSLVQNPRIFLHCVKNKHPSFYVSCTSLLWPFFWMSIYISRGSNKTRKPRL